MANEMKYVTFNHATEVTAVLFPNWVQHCDMASYMPKGRFEFGKPISAGFVRIKDDGTIEAYGKSVSMGLKSDPEFDSQLIAWQFGRGEYPR
jgi:hypothetical protein